MTDTAPAAPTPGYKDRKTGLVLFGILQILAGCGCLFFLAIMGITMAASATLEGDPDLQIDAISMVPGLVIYGLAAILFFWLGIGSILARRWARALSLMLSWFGLLVGVCALVGVAFFMPGMEGIDEEAQMAATIGMIFALVVLFLLFVLVPALQILFYGSKNVKATCEARDPKIRWTDKRPLPVLAVTIVLWYGVVSMLWAGLYNWVVPFFGTILSGATGAVVILLNMSVQGLIAWSYYKLRIEAWWGVVLLHSAWALSMIITFSRLPLIALYEKTGMPDAQLEIMREVSRSNPSLLLIGAATMIPYLAFLIYTKKYFKTPVEVNSPVA
jgi:hypothetical protein